MFGDDRTDSGFIEHQKPSFMGPSVDELGQGFYRFDVRDAEPTALFGRLNGMGAHALRVNAGRIGMTGKNWAKPENTQFRRFFNQESGSGFFQGCEGQPGPRFLFLGAGLLLNDHISLFFADSTNPGSPFTVPAVEQQDLIPGAQAHDIAQIIGLEGAKGNRPTGGKGLLYKKPRKIMEIRIHCCHTGKNIISLDIS